MCGRFTRNYTWAQIDAMYSLTSPRVEPTAALQHLPDRHGRCRGRSPARGDVLGPDPRVVGQATQGVQGGHVQYTGRDGRGETDVSHGVQELALSHTSVGLLRMADH